MTSLCANDFEPLFDCKTVPSEHDHCIVLHQDQLLLIEQDGDLRFPRWGDMDELEANLVQQHYIGKWNGKRCFAFVLSPKHHLSETFIPHDIRTLIASMGPASFHAVARARQLTRFISTQRYCSQCAEALMDSAKEFARFCPKCKTDIYPVIAPAIIVSVVRGREILLAHNRNFAQPIHSLVAGFVESGETLEQAVAREVREEVGVAVNDIRYVTSQPWPFPNSLMVGFTAQYASGEIQVDGQEIDHAEWFSVEHLPDLPRVGSLSRLLIENWLASQAQH